MSVVHANSAMLAATRGIKLETLSVLDFLPSDSMKWQKRKKLKSSAIKHPKIQADIIKKAFGF